jgi:tetratricopeptide (TPR) repeat protein
MPAERRFAQGSIIYFDHEKGDSIYILKSGRVDLSYVQPESGEKITKTLSQGEFFGLKSAIINHTRDEVAEAVTDTLTIEFKTAEFESYVSQNVELLKRLLRVLSNQLRNLGIKVNNYLGNNVLYPPNIGLFKIGEYYLNNKEYKQSVRVYERYIQQYPQTNIVEEAKYRIEISQEAIKTGFLKEFKPIDQIIEGELAGADAAPLNAVVDTKDSMVNAHSKLGIKEIMDKYYKAQSFFNGEDYASAEKIFQEMFALELSSANPDMVNNAKLMYFNSLVELKKFNECSQEITEFIKTLKDPPAIKKTLFILSDIYKNLGNTEGEKSILQKITMMPPIDELSKKAKERMTNL